jgi:hypothetical protein
MKKWTLILLLAAAVLLFLWTAREGFQDTASLKGPPYGDSDYPTIVNLMPATLVKALETANSAEKPVLPPNPTAADNTRYAQKMLEYQRKLVDVTISDVMGDFHTSVYQPAKAALKESDVNTFVNTKATAGFLKENKADIKKLLKAYFVDQTAGDANAALTEAQTRSAAAAAASGYAGLRDASNSGTGLTEACRTEIESKQWADVSSECKGQTTSGTTAASGNTTGGSTTTAGSTSGPNNGNIWGPAFMGLGDNAGDGGAGFTKRDYPTLIGPKPRESTMVEGAGIAPLSQHTTLVTSGALPGASSTGSDANSQYFGTSRMPAGASSSKTPGDKDLFPNPYQEFTPSIGSTKTEPVPYLADFSAFLH